MATNSTQALAKIGAQAKRIAAWLPPDTLGPRFNPRWFLGFAKYQLQNLYDENDRKVRKDPTIPKLKIVDGSIATSLVTFAMAGLVPNPALGLGYLVPYKPAKSEWSVLTPIFGYKGLIELARRSGGQRFRVREVRSGVICEGDRFDDSLSTEEMIRGHRPATERSQESFSKLLYAYCAVRQVDHFGEFWQTLLQTRGDVETLRRRSAAQKGPWVDWPLQMAAKGPIRRIITSGQVPVDYLAGTAVSAEAHADAQRYDQARAAFQAAQQAGVGEGQGAWIDEAACEVIEATEAAEESPAAEPATSVKERVKSKAKRKVPEPRWSDDPEEIDNAIKAAGKARDGETLAALKGHVATLTDPDLVAELTGAIAAERAGAGLDK